MKKFFLVFIVSLLMCFGVKAQNPTLVYSDNLLRITPSGQHTGKITIGIDTTGAVAGNVVTFNGASVVWGAGGGGGGGGDIFSASNNVFKGTTTGTLQIISNTASRANITLSAGNATINDDSSEIALRGTNGAVIKLQARESAGNQRSVIRFGASDDIVVDWQQGGPLNLGTSSGYNVQIGHSSKDLTIASLNVNTLGGQNWGGGDLVYSGVGGTLSNLGSFTSVKTITASNFVQSAGSAGGFVGNGSGLTNLNIASSSFSDFARLSSNNVFKGTSTGIIQTVSNTSGGGYVILQAASSIDPLSSSLILGATQTLGRVSVAASASGGVESFNLKVGVGENQIMNWQGGQLNIGISGNDNITIGHSAKDLVLGSLNVSTLGNQNWNSGSLIFNTTVLSNTTGFTSTKAITSSNFVSTASTAQWSTGTIPTWTLSINSGNGAGTVSATNMFFSGLINAPTNSAAFVKDITLAAANQILTNNTGSRQYAIFSVALSPAVAGTATARLVQTAPTALTNCTVSAVANADGLARIETLAGFFSPGAIYFVTNQSTGSGATVAISNSVFTTF